MAALIGALRVSLSADTAAFQSGMRKAERQAKTSASSIQKSLGLVKAGFIGLASGLSIGLITQGIKAGLDYAGALGEVSQQLGVTTKDLQVFRYAAGQVGVSQGELETGLSKLTITLGKVAAGAKAPIAALNAIGISVDQIKGKDTGEAFRIIADGLQKITDRSQRAAVEVALFGRSGAQLDTLLSGGSAALNELSDAAERLGIILSDEQIQKADETADKLDALQTVLKAQIAGVVADNADAILGLANALMEVAAASARAITNFGKFVSFVSQNLGFLANPIAAIANGGLIGTGNVRGLNRAGSSVTVDLPAAKKQKATGGANIGQFLAGGGGGKSKRAPRAPRDTSLRDAFQFEEEQRRAEMDILRAKQDLAHDYVERTALSIQMLNLEKEGFEAELQFRIASKEITKAQADKLRLKNDEVDQLNRMKVLEDQEEQRQRDYNMLEDRDFDAKMELLEKQADLAETSKERRAIELKIIDLAYEEQRRRLQRLIDESKDWAEIEAARRAILDSYKNQAADRQGAAQNNRSPIQDYKARYKSVAEENEEAFVNMLEGVSDALSKATDGLKELKESLLDTFKSFFQTLLKNQLNQIFASLLPSGGFKLPGFALGGNTIGVPRTRIAGFVHGDEGILNPRGLKALGVPNLDALNRGQPLTAVSNDNYGGRGVVINQNFPNSDYDSFRRNQRQLARETKRGLSIA